MEIRTYESGDEHKILGLFKLTFGREMSMDYWKWRFMDNPFGKHMIYLMWDGDKLSGHSAVSPNELSINGQHCNAALSMTSMIHPGYRGKGIFTSLTEELYRTESASENLDIVWGFPNNNSHRVFINKLDWKNVAIIPTFSLKVAGFRYRKNDLMPFYCQADGVGQKQADKYADLLSGYGVRLNKDYRYFRWRYTDNPVNVYHVLGGEDGTFIIAKTYVENGSLEVDVVEWAVPNEFEQMKKAINDLISYFSKQDLEPESINMWMPLNDPRYTNLEWLGFVNREPLTFLGYRFLSNQPAAPGPDSWFYQMGDSDVY